MSVVTASLLGISAVLMALLFKGRNSEYGNLVVMAAGILLFFCGTGQMKAILSAVRQVRDAIGIEDAYLTALLKMAGITYIAEFASGICRDAGYQAMGTQIEIFARLSVLAVSTPILLALLETMKGFLE